MENLYCDLHVHSYYSDGTCSPTEIIELAEKLGLSSVALTDHDGINGLDEFVRAAEGKRVEAIRGIEISTDYKGNELHIVGLFLPEGNLKKLKQLIESARERKELSNIDLIKRLNEAGYAIDCEAVRATSKGIFNRAHVACALLEKGYVSSVQEAFDTVLSKERGLYVPSKHTDAFEAIKTLKDVGAVTVLAHPFLALDEEGIREFCIKARDCGLDAIEVIYSTYSDEQTAAANRIADELGLKKSGGSDFHGTRKVGISLGVGRGSLAVPASFVEKLRKGERAKSKLLYEDDFRNDPKAVETDKWIKIAFGLCLTPVLALISLAFLIFKNYELAIQAAAMLAVTASVAIARGPKFRNKFLHVYDDKIVVKERFSKEKTYALTPGQYTVTLRNGSGRTGIQLFYVFGDKLGNRILCYKSHLLGSSFSRHKERYSYDIRDVGCRIFDDIGWTKE